MYKRREVFIRKHGQPFQNKGKQIMPALNKNNESFAFVISALA